MLNAFDTSRVTGLALAHLLKGLLKELLNVSGYSKYRTTQRLSTGSKYLAPGSPG